MKKRLVAFSLMLVLVLSMACTAFASTKPTMTVLRSPATSVTRGGKVSVKLRLESKSYKAKYGGKRAQLRCYVVDPDNYVIGKYRHTFTGKQEWTVNWTTSKTQAKGTYKFARDMWYRSKPSVKWKSTTPGYWWYNNVKVK